MRRDAGVRQLGAGEKYTSSVTLFRPGGCAGLFYRRQFYTTGMRTSAAVRKDWPRLIAVSVEPDLGRAETKFDYRIRDTESICAEAHQSELHFAVQS